MMPIIRRGFCMSASNKLNEITVKAIYINFFSKNTSDYAERFSRHMGKSNYPTGEVSTHARKALILLGIVEDKQINAEVNRIDAFHNQPKFCNRIKVDEINLKGFTLYDPSDRIARTNKKLQKGDLEEKLDGMYKRRKNSFSQRERISLRESIRRIKKLAFERSKSLMLNEDVKPQDLIDRKNEIRTDIASLYNEMRYKQEGSKKFLMLENEIEEKTKQARELGDITFILEMMSKNENT